MVRLEGTTKRWIGVSTDIKPHPGAYIPGIGEITDADVTPGSSFMETDTGRIFRWNGREWALGDTPEAIELREIKAYVAAIHDHMTRPVL